MMDLSLKKCTANDLDELRALSEQTYYDTFAAMNTPENMAAYLKEAFAPEKLAAELADPASSFYFLYADGALAGYLKLNEAPSQTDINDAATLEIERIYVRAHYQGQGLGRFLMTQAIQMAKARKKRAVWLGVWEKNARALRFYRANGFAPIGTHSFTMGDEVQTDFIMQKEL